VPDYPENHYLIQDVLQLPSPRHPQYELAVKQMFKPTGLFPDRLKINDIDQAFKKVSRL